MNTNDDRILTAWLEAAAPAREPEHLLPSVLMRTRRTRRRPAWLLPERWLAMETVTARVAPNVGPPLRWVALGALIVLAAVAVAIVMAGANRPRLPAPFGPAANGQLAYSRGGQVFVRDTLSGTERLLAVGPHAVGPEFSRDGSRIAWLEGEDAELSSAALVVANADGTDARAVGDPLVDPSWLEWSPSGDAIAVIDHATPIRNLAIVPTDGAEVMRLGTGLEVDQVSWRPPDGRQLVLRAREGDGAWGFYLVSRDGGGITRLALDPGFEQDRDYLVNTDYYFFDPAWSPDGSRLAFHTLDDVFGPGDSDPGFRVHLAEIGPAGEVTSERLIENDPSIDDEWSPLWLPDGSGLVYGRTEEGAQAIVIDRFGGQAAPVAFVNGSGPQRFDSVVVLVAPDGNRVVALTIRGPADNRPAGAWEVDVADGSVSTLDLRLDDWATWQRLAP